MTKKSFSILFSLLAGTFALPVVAMDNSPVSNYYAKKEDGAQKKARKANRKRAKLRKQLETAYRKKSDKNNEENRVAFSEALVAYKKNLDRSGVTASTKK